MMAQSYDGIPRMSVEVLAERLTQAAENPVVAAPLQLIDVREPQEIAIAQVDGFVNLPLSQFQAWSGNIQSQFDPDAETVVMCHHGIRSAQMCQWLMQQGFTNVKNLSGGIAAYASAIDPSIPQY
jgi:rhodanese-related sulfurtransferase